MSGVEFHDAFPREYGYASATGYNVYRCRDDGVVRVRWGTEESLHDALRKFWLDWHDDHTGTLRLVDGEGFTIAIIGVQNGGWFTAEVLRWMAQTGHAPDAVEHMELVARWICVLAEIRT